jgi:hypothetical protein
MQEVEVEMILCNKSKTLKTDFPVKVNFLNGKIPSVGSYVEPNEFNQDDFNENKFKVKEIVEKNEITKLVLVVESKNKAWGNNFL